MGTMVHDNRKAVETLGESVTIDEVQAWAAGLEAMHERIAHHFARHRTPPACLGLSAGLA